MSDNGKTLSYNTTGDATYYARFAKIIVVDNPEIPVVPVKPADVDEPAASEEPATADTQAVAEGSVKAESLKTGDEGNPVLWTALLLMSMTALAGLIAGGRKQK